MTLRRITVFRQTDLQRSYFVVPVVRAIYLRAGDLCLNHPLRAYDAIQLGHSARPFSSAIQLACALAARKDAIQAQIPPPIFVCANADLLAAATAVSRTSTPRATASW